MKKVKRIAAIVLACMSIVGVSGCGKKDKPIILPNIERAKNVILMIGDGMGQDHIRAGEVYNEGKLTMQKFPYSTMVETRSFNAEITDSAAAATALATGVRTNNGYVGLDPVTAEPLETIVDIAAGLGKRTGVITTDELTGATPMGFSGHSTSRDYSNELIKSAVSSNVNLFISNNYSGEVNLINGGYKKINDPTMISESTEEKLCGIFTIMSGAPSMQISDSICSLDGLVAEALDYLAQDEDGFFLMTEGALIDKRSHSNYFELMISELMAFDNAVKAVLNWAKDRDDTVVIVTSDHETGGLELSNKITKDNMFAQSSFAAGGFYQWNSKDHTGEDVYCFINGANIDFSQYSFGSKDRIKNSDIFQIMKTLMGA